MTSRRPAGRRSVFLDARFLLQHQPKQAIDESRAAQITAYLRPNPLFSLAADGFEVAPGQQGIWRPFSGVLETSAITYLHDYMAGALKALGGSGADIYSLSDAELKATKERMQTVFDKIAESAGEPGKSVAAHLKPYW